MIKNIIKIFFAVLLIAVIFIAITLWRMGSNGSCFMYGAIYTQIKTVAIDGKKYYLYQSTSGMQDKSYIISLSPVELPDTICDYSAIKTPIYSTDFDNTKMIEKISISKKSDGSFYIEPFYSKKLTGGNIQDFSDVELYIVNEK